MGTKLLYGILFAWVKVHAILPMRILYILSDVLYVLIYKIVGYRLKIVRRNMQASFPEKSAQELKQLEKRFYHHFSDYIVETIKLAHLPVKEALRRAHITNPELIEPYLAQNNNTFMLLMGHYGNWEWFSASPARFDDVQIHQIYRPLTNKAFDKLFIYLRTRYGAYGIKKNDTFRDIFKLKKENTRSLVIFISDQTPSKNNLHYWTQFLNQDTPILNGPERIAKKLNIPVIFLDVKKIKRGYYTVDFVLMTDNPKETPDNWITEQYARKMEQSILRDPAYWLWTHKRWKHKHEDA